MPWRVVGNHLVICREAPDGKFEVREYNSFKGRIEMALERCDTLKEAEKSLEKYAGIARAMTDCNSLTERQRDFQCGLREAVSVAPGGRVPSAERKVGIERTIQVGR
jgi:hypothetical protein